MTVKILQGDCREVLRTLPDESVHCVVTSPPYWGLRDYGVAGQLGMERTYQDHVAEMADLFEQVRRVLRKNGTLWLNYGDSYAASVNGRSAADTKAAGMDGSGFKDPQSFNGKHARANIFGARIAIDGHDDGKRNKRSVWQVATAPFSEAHFATFPPALIEPCIKAGCPVGGTVLDPFGGAGTTGLVADRLKRDAILIELNPEYATMAESRISNDAGMFASVSKEAAE